YCVVASSSSVVILLHLRFFFFFFFSSRRRHTRSKRDWSSDVCSSDLDIRLSLDCGGLDELVVQADRRYLSRIGLHLLSNAVRARSEERRVGKECRSRGAPGHEKKKKEEGGSEGEGGRGRQGEDRVRDR